MGKCYDNWGRLVEAVMRREQLRSISLAESRSPSIRSLDSDYSFSSSSWRDSLSFSPSPLHTDVERFRLDGNKLDEIKWLLKPRMLSGSACCLLVVSLPRKRVREKMNGEELKQYCMGW